MHRGELSSGKIGEKSDEVGMEMDEDRLPRMAYVHQEKARKRREDHDEVD